MPDKLYLGVYDKPYAATPGGTPPPRKGKRRRIVTAGTYNSTRAKSTANTTGQVATILEENYALIQTFFDRHEQEIADDIGEAEKDALEALISGETAHNPMAAAEAAITARFKKALDQREFDGMIGVPTKASIKGTSSRNRNQPKRPGRASFIDTGMFQESFVAWIK